MGDMLSWTDPRDRRAWKVHTGWGGQPGMGVGMDVDLSKIPRPPAPPASRRIRFFPADGQGPHYGTSMGEDERDADELSNKDLEDFLDRALDQPSIRDVQNVKAAARARGFEWRDSWRDIHS